MAKNTINLISSVSNDYSTLIKVKLNGEEVVLVGKQNFAFNKPYSFDSFREKHANFLKTLHSFPKSYFTERNDDAKKDVLIPSIKSYNVAQVGNKFITLNNISNNPIMYNGNIGRIFGSYYYDTNDFIYGSLNYDVLEKYVNYGIDDETFKNNILKYLKDNLYNNPTPTKSNGDVITSYDELQDYEYGAALERPRKGYSVIENVKGLTIYGDLDYIDPNSTEAPTNSFYEIDDNWIWNTADNKSPKPVFTNFSRLQNNLSPLSQPELTFETSTPQFRMWRKYHNMGINDSNNLWLSYNLELARSSLIELNPWRTETNPVSTIDDELETNTPPQLVDVYTPITLAYGDKSKNFVSTIGKQFENSLFNGYSFFISFDGSTQAIGKPMIMIMDGNEPLFSVLHNPLQQLFLYGEESPNTTNISSSVISSWSNDYISNYLDESNEYVETSINTIIPKNDSTQSLMYNITMDNNINSGDYINNNNQVIIKTNSTLSLDNMGNGISFKFTTDSNSAQSLKFSQINGSFNETFKTKSYSNTTNKSFNYSINLNSDRKLAFKGTVNIDSFNLNSDATNITLTNTSDSNDTLTVNLSTNDSVNFRIQLSDGNDIQIINNSNTGSSIEFAMFGNTITITGVNSIYTNYKDTSTNEIHPISIIYVEGSDSTPNYFSCLYNGDTYTCSEDAVLECFENIAITINASGFIEDFYLHPLTSSVLSRILVDDNYTIEFGSPLTNDINSSTTHNVIIPSISETNDISFIDIFGSQFALTLGNTTFTTVDGIDVSNPTSESYKTSFIINNNIYATISGDKKTLYCTIVGEGFDESPLDSIIEINNKSLKSTNPILYAPSSSNTLNYITDKSKLNNTDNIVKDSDIYNVLKHNLFKRFLNLESTKEVVNSNSVDTLTIDSYAKCYVTFVLDQINSKPIELRLFNSTDDSKPIHTFTTKELVTQLELEPGETYKFKYSDESSIGADNSLNKNFEKIYIEYYSYPDNFDDETFEHIINDYTEFKHKQIELTSTPISIFNSSLTSQCVILQDISNIEESVSITIKGKPGDEYNLFLDEALIIGSTDMSQVCAASKYEGTLLDVYYTIFNSKNIEQYTNLHFSKSLNIATSGSISYNAIIQSKDSLTGNILNLYGKYSIGTDETVIYETLENVSPSKKHIISGVDYGLYLELSSMPGKDCKLLIDDNEICAITKQTTNIRFSTLGYNITSEQITLSNYSGTVDKFIVYPLYTNYFPSISGFSNKLLTDSSKSSVYSAKIHIVPNSKFNNTNVIRNLFSYDSLMTISDNTNTTKLARQTISYSSELQYYVHEPKLTDNDKDDWNDLRDDLNNNVITNYDLNIKSIFGGFSIYDDKVVISDPLLRSYNYAELSSIGFVIEFNDSEEFKDNEITIKTFINGNIVDATFNSKYDDSDTSELWKKLYDKLNYGNLTITYGETPSKIHAVRSWNYALDDSVFNMLHNQFSLYQDVSTINNEIYEYRFYDTENRLGDWVLTDESVFNKRPVMFEPKELEVLLNYTTIDDDIKFNVVLNYSIQNTVYNYKWYKNGEIYDVENETSNTITIKKADVENGDKWHVVVTYGDSDTSYTSNTIELSTTFNVSLCVKNLNNNQIYENESTIDIIRYNSIDIYVDDNNDNLTYIWQSKKLYPAENSFTDIANNTEKQITISNLGNSCEYKCTITNSNGFSIEKIVKINVVLNSSSISYVESGDNYKFTCETDPDLTDTTGIKIDWYKNDNLLPPQPNNTNYPYTYTISKTDAKDCKFYAIVTFENSKVYKSINIIIDNEKNITSPVILRLNDLPTTKTLTEGDALELSITLKTPEGNSTYGTIEYEIYKNDGVIKTGELLEGPYTITYTKNYSTTTDSGEYYIKLWNDAGKITSNRCNVTVATTQHLSRYYVVPNGAGNKDGSSWANAYDDVQTAIDKASASSVATSSNSVEVWIAKGTYKHGSAMIMKNNVAIYGGFAGTETAKDERTSGNFVYLDGEGKYSVFYNSYSSSNPLTNSAKLDNVTIQNGYISGDGAGMYNYYASPEITNCTFANNQASSYGAGMYNYYASPEITNCTFANNSAKYYGGGMHNLFSNPTLTNCTFSNNSAGITGGGMCNNYSSPELTNCILWGNTESSSGNEIYNNGSSSNPTIDTCIIKGGYSSNGTYTNIITADPKLQLLTYNGGSVQTIAVAGGSSAIGAGKVVESVTTDARGVVRSTTAPTIGAYEHYTLVSDTYYVSTNGTGSGMTENDPADYRKILANKNISNGFNLSLRFAPGTYEFNSGFNITGDSNLSILPTNNSSNPNPNVIFEFDLSTTSATPHAFHITSSSHLSIGRITIKLDSNTLSESYIIYASKSDHIFMSSCNIDGSIYLNDLECAPVFSLNNFSGSVSETFPDISRSELETWDIDITKFNTFGYVLSSYSLARSTNQITENVEYKLITDLNDINYDTDVIAVRFSPWQTQYNKFDVKYDYEDSEKGSDNHRLFLIKDYDYLDRFAGLYRLDNGEGRASNLYSIKISNSGFATNNYVPGTDDYELQELMNTTCKAALDNAIVSLTKKIQPINTQLFKVIYDDPGFTS